jgi:hypothetical protein
MPQQNGKQAWQALAREKSYSREADERALASGQKQAAQLRQENSFFSSNRMQCDLKGAKRLW